MKSDTWDRGNHLTRFEEVTEVCEYCNGRGVVNIEDDEGYEIEANCPDCNGEGIITYNK